MLSNSQKRQVFQSSAFRDYSGAQKGGNVVLEDVRHYCLRKVQKQRSDLKAELAAVGNASQQIGLEEADY